MGRNVIVNIIKYCQVNLRVDKMFVNKSTLIFFISIKLISILKLRCLKK